MNRWTDKVTLDHLRHWMAKTQLAEQADDVVGRVTAFHSHAQALLESPVVLVLTGKAEKPGAPSLRLGILADPTRQYEASKLFESEVAQPLASVVSLELYPLQGLPDNQDGEERIGYLGLTDAGDESLTAKLQGGPRSPDLAIRIYKELRARSRPSG